MNLERLHTMHKRIESETTGTPEEFAEDFKIRKRQLQNEIEELRFLGAKIKYCRKEKTYYYAEPFDSLKILIIKDLSLILQKA